MQGIWEEPIQVHLFALGGMKAPDRFAVRHVNARHCLIAQIIALLKQLHLPLHPARLLRFQTPGFRRTIPWRLQAHSRTWAVRLLRKDGRFHAFADFSARVALPKPPGGLTLAPQPRSFTQHFCRDKNENGSTEATSKEQIENGVTRGSEHGFQDEGNHSSMKDECWLRPATVLRRWQGSYD
jgi:hypothetical protein